MTLRTFGALDLSGPEGEEITAILSQPKRLALLIYLAVAGPGEFHRRDTLLSLFWPERDDVRARNALSQSLSYLRRHLPEEVLITRGAEEVGVDPGILKIDVEDFRRAIEGACWGEALDLYHGDFLHGFHVGGARGFEEWMEGERERLREAAAGAAWSLAREQIEGGALVEAERSAQKALGLVWTDEAPFRDFMEALAKAGDGVSALNLYERYCIKLRQELDVEPSQATKEVADAVRSGELTGPLPSWRQTVRTPAPTPIHGQSPIGTQPRTLTATATATTEPAPAEASPVLPKIPRRHWAGALVVLVPVLGAGALSWYLTQDPGLALIPDLVVVPPFENRTGDPALDEVALDASAWVEEAIQQVEGVQLVPSSFARGYAREAETNGSPNPARAVALRSRAGWVVAGVINDLGDSVEIRAEIIDVSHQRKEQEVAEVGSRDALNDVIDRLAQRMSGALAYEFDPWMGESETGSEPLPSPPTLEAFREHRLGYEAYNLRDHAASFRHHMAAYALDSTLVRALVAAAFMADDSDVGDSLAQIASQRRAGLSRRGKLDLDILLALQANDLERALRAMKELARLEGGGFNSVLVSWFAMKLNRPGEGLAYTERYDPTLEWRREEAQYYWLYRTQDLHMLGEFEKELAEARQGRGTYPDFPHLLTSEVRALAALGRVEEVSDLLHQARGLSDTNYTAALVAGAELREHGFLSGSKDAFNRAAEWLTVDGPPEELSSLERSQLAEALYGAERWDEARAVAESILAEAPNDMSALSMVGLTEARMGDSAQATEVIDRLSTMSRRDSPGEHLYNMASILAVLDQPEEAMRTLFRAFSEGLPYGLRLHQDMNLESLRERKDFRALVKPKG